mgnify:CR=1 FL=1
MSFLREKCGIRNFSDSSFLSDSSFFSDSRKKMDSTDTSHTIYFIHKGLLLLLLSSYITTAALIVLFTVDTTKNIEMVSRKIIVGNGI